MDKQLNQTVNDFPLSPVQEDCEKAVTDGFRMLLYLPGALAVNALPVPLQYFGIERGECFNGQVQRANEGNLFDFLQYTVQPHAP
ncbi:hypothetical protein, partial [Thiolapillus sp.]